MQRSVLTIDRTKRADEESRQEMFELCKQDVYSRLTALRQEVVEVFNLPFEEDPEDSTPF